MSFDDVRSLSFEKFSIKNVYIQIKDENSTLTGCLKVIRTSTIGLAMRSKSMFLAYCKN